jgi:MFS family permease
MGISMHSFIRRIPMAAGPVIGGILITSFGIIHGIKIAFSVSVLLCLAGMIMQTKLKDNKPEKFETIHLIALWKNMDIRLKNLLISDILVRFCEQIPYVFVVIWCIDNLKVTPAFFGILTAIEMIVAALIYIPVASYSDRMEKKPFIVITFLFFSAFPILLFLSKSYLALVFAFVIRGLKEFGEPTRKALITELSPAETKSRTFGLYYFIRDSIVSLAAFFGGWLWLKGPGINLITASCFGILGTLLFILFGKNRAPVPRIR